MANSHERHEDTRSRATTWSPMTREPSHTAENPTTCTGRPVPTVESWDAGSGVETKEECDILSAHSISFKEKVDERLRIILNRSIGDKMEGIDLNLNILGIFMTSSMHAAVFLGGNYSENLHSIRNSDQKPTVQSLFDVTHTLIREQELAISGVSELDWSDSKWEKLHLASDKEGYPAHEGKSLCILRLCIVCGKNSSIPAIKLRLGRQIGVVQKHTAIQKNRMGSMVNQCSSSGKYSQDTPHCRSSERSKSGWENYIYVYVQRHHLEK